MRKSLIELNWNDFQDFILELGVDRFRMSKHLESIVQSQRYFSEPSRKINLSHSKLSSEENNYISASSIQLSLISKKLFASEENTPSFPILHTLVLVTSNLSTISLSQSSFNNESVVSISNSTLKSVTDLTLSSILSVLYLLLYPPQYAIDLSLSKHNSTFLPVETKESSTLLTVETKSALLPVQIKNPYSSISRENI